MERRGDIVEVLRARGYGRLWDMSAAEKQGAFFEGTGVLVLDRVNGVAYVNLSERADADLARQWVDRMGYKVPLVPLVDALELLDCRFWEGHLCVQSGDRQMLEAQGSDGHLFVHKMVP